MMTSFFPKRSLFMVLLLFFFIKVCFSCGEDEFECRITDKCIDMNYLCDGDDDCEDNSDEDENICVKGMTEQDFDKVETRQQCDPEQFNCEDDTLKCITRDWLCDGDSDCESRRDEEPQFCSIRYGDTTQSSVALQPTPTIAIPTYIPTYENFTVGTITDHIQFNSFYTTEISYQDTFPPQTVSTNPVLTYNSLPENTLETSDLNQTNPEITQNSPPDAPLEDAQNKTSCNEDEFECQDDPHSNIKCVAKNSTCNQEKDCLNGEDEDPMLCDTIKAASVTQSLSKTNKSGDSFLPEGIDNSSFNPHGGVDLPWWKYLIFSLFLLLSVIACSICAYCTRKHKCRNASLNNIEANNVKENRDSVIYENVRSTSGAKVVLSLQVQSRGTNTSTDIEQPPSLPIISPTATSRV